jgi:5-methylcytosine-specific restriction protein A
MRTAWQGSTRSERLPSDWRSRRLIVIERAGGICEATDPRYGARCTRSGEEVDHIVAGDDHDFDNLRLLCKQNHAAKTAREARAGRRTPRRRRP